VLPNQMRLCRGFSDDGRRRTANSLFQCSFLQLSFGSYALASNTFGGDNNAFGYGALERNMEGCYNNASTMRHWTRLRRSTQLSRKPLRLELHLESNCASKVGHLVIKNALVRLASRQRTYSAQGKIFVHAIVCGKRQNFADVIATSFIILAHH
jgi:hypothetical protein